MGSGQKRDGLVQERCQNYKHPQKCGCVKIGGSEGKVHGVHLRVQRGLFSGC